MLKFAALMGDLNPLLWAGYKLSIIIIIIKVLVIYYT